ncbi:HET-domain-containing protein [Lophium mytilinum]|uniref:HET-domain-containing protein n=1 Tax=Lophium mytilinum TaxID=390894 RepID=A0A6A6R2A6_9PEZI|nr:HET-domain-containing protein [Lophium mytilinum]
MARSMRCWPRDLHAEPPRLIITSASEKRYAALSHCWGELPAHSTTTVTNFEERLTSIDFDTLPANFRDAIEATRKTGLEYLWIDALCLI